MHCNTGLFSHNGSFRYTVTPGGSSVKIREYNFFLLIFLITGPGSNPGVVKFKPFPSHYNSNVIIV